MRRWQLVIDDTGSVEGIDAFIYCTKWRSGRVSRMPDSLTDFEDSATQLLTKYKSGALVTQFNMTSTAIIYQSYVISFEENFALSQIDLGRCYCFVLFESVLNNAQSLHCVHTFIHISLYCLQ